MQSPSFGLEKSNVTSSAINKDLEFSHSIPFSSVASLHLEDDVPGIMHTENSVQDTLPFQNEKPFPIYLSLESLMSNEDGTKKPESSYIQTSDSFDSRSSPNLQKSSLATAALPSYHAEVEVETQNRNQANTYDFHPSKSFNSNNGDVDKDTNREKNPADNSRSKSSIVDSSLTDKSQLAENVSHSSVQKPLTWNTGSDFSQDAVVDYSEKEKFDETPAVQGRTLSRDSSFGSDKNCLSSLFLRATEECMEERRSSIYTIRQLSKRSREDRLHIAKSCSVPSFLTLLSSKDDSILSHSLIILRNLTLEKENLDFFDDSLLLSVIASFLRPSITSELRNLAVETLFRLSTLDHFKVGIGKTNSIPLLIEIFVGLPPPMEPSCILHNPPSKLESGKLRLAGERVLSPPKPKLAPLSNSRTRSSSLASRKSYNPSHSNLKSPPNLLPPSLSSRFLAKKLLGKLFPMTVDSEKVKPRKSISKSPSVPVERVNEAVKDNEVARSRSSLPSTSNQPYPLTHPEPTAQVRTTDEISFVTFGRTLQSAGDDFENSNQKKENGHTEQYFETVSKPYLDPHPKRIPEPAHHLEQGSTSHSHSHSPTSSSSETPSTCTCADSIPLFGLSLSCKALYNLSLYRPNKKKMVDAMVIPSLISFLHHDLQSSIVVDSICLLASLSYLSEAREGIVAGEGIGLLVECLDDSTDAGKEYAVSALLNIAMAKPYWISMIMSEATMPTLVKLSNTGTDRAREKSKKLLHLLRRHTRDM